jgi:succinate dehydrogenase / fumarate reductase membrane anchor subunit
MKESTLMKLQYITAIAAIILVSFHLLMQGVLVPYSTALSFQNVLSVYRSWIDGSLLEIMLVVVVAHGFNGLRVVLLELRQARLWSVWVGRGALVAAILAIAYGTRTIILAVTGTVS